MIKNKKLICALCAVFLATETLIGVCIHTSSGRMLNFNQFCSIIYACLFCLLFIERSSAYIFTQIALIFTVFADYFLVWVAPQMKLYGMLFFSVAQLAYAARLYFDTESKTARRWQIISRVILCALLVLTAVLVLGDNTDALSLISMFYYANLIMSIVFAFMSFKKNCLMAIGFVLFILCDTIIGISVIKPMIPPDVYAVIYSIIYPGFDLSWVFYLPSQMLLSISLLPHKFKKADSK